MVGNRCTFAPALYVAARAPPPEKHAPRARPMPATPPWTTAGDKYGSPDGLEVDPAGLLSAQRISP